MALLDRQRNVVVLRIVYDGAAESGKTTTVRALSERLGRTAVTPQAGGERTLYFDWLDYTGGLFEGYQLRCQLISVPGQAMLAHRRAYLLGTADAVVHVGVFEEATLARTVALLSELSREARMREPVPVGIVVQANKRDATGALPLERVRDALSEAGVRASVVETVATEGAGVRETFVFAVRLALDRVRELLKMNALPEGSPDIDDPNALLRDMKAREIEHAPSSAGTVQAASIAEAVQLAAPAPPPSDVEAAQTDAAQTDAAQTEAGRALLEVVAEEHAVAAPSAARRPEAHEVPAGPTESVPSGMVWPPIEGRMHLADATAAAPELTAGAGGWWASTERGWRFHSEARAVFADADDGRGALILLARAHAAQADVLSNPRCVVLAPDGHGRWRLWQILRERVSLRERLSGILDEQDPNKIARMLVDTALRLIEMDERLRRSGPAAFQPTLDTVGVFSGVTQYVGLCAVGPPPGDGTRLSLEREMGPVVLDWSGRRGELLVALRRLAGTGGISPAGAVAGTPALEVGVIQRLGQILLDAP